MEAILEMLPLLIPVLVIQFGLMIVSLIHIFKHDTYKIGSRPLWAAICIFIGIIGPVLYFAIGKGED